MNCYFYISVLSSSSLSSGSSSLGSLSSQFFQENKPSLSLGEVMHQNILSLPTVVQPLYVTWLYSKGKIHPPEYPLEFPLMAGERGCCRGSKFEETSISFSLGSESLQFFQGSKPSLSLGEVAHQNTLSLPTVVQPLYVTWLCSKGKIHSPE